MFNPDFLSVDKQRLVLDALLALNNETYLEDGVVGDAVVTGCLDVNANTVDEAISPSQCGDQILANILNTNGLVQADTETHLGIYGSLIGAIPGISNYFDTKYDISS
jgi:hypothetical protein